MRSVRKCLGRAAAAALRALLVVLLLAAPVLAVPKGAGGARFLEAPGTGNGGIGLVLLMSLRRA